MAGYTLFNDPSAATNAGTFPQQARPDKVDFDIIVAADAQTGVGAGCAVTAHSSGASMNVDVAAGTVWVAGVGVATGGLSNIAVTAGDASLNRRDLVVVNNAGTVSVVAGTLAVIPCLPNVPANSVAVAVVEVPAATSAITASNITDKRLFVLNYVVANDANVVHLAGAETITGAKTFQGGTAGTVVVNGQVTGDTNPRLAIQADGTLKWGSGSASADLTMNRQGGALAIFTGGGQTTVTAGGSIGTPGEIIARNGSSTTVTIGNVGPASQSGITFQNAESGSNLYRSAAGTLKIDGSLITGGTSTTAIPLTLKAAPLQTADIMELLDSNGNVLSRYDLAGNLIGPVKPTVLTGGVGGGVNNSFGNPTLGGTRDNMLDPNTASIETSAAGWVAQNNCAVARSTTKSLDGVASLTLTSSAAGDMQAGTPTGTSGVAVVPGQAYTVSAWFLTAVSARKVAVAIYWWQASGSASAHANDFGSNFADNAVGWTQAIFTAVAPSDAAYASVAVYVTGPGAANEVHYVDSISLAPTLSPFAGINPNLIGNSDFEQDISGWATGFATIARSTAQAFTGLASLSASMTAGENRITYTSPVMVAGTVYTVSAYVYFPSGGTWAGGAVGITNDGGSWSNTTSVSANPATKNTWQRISLTGTCTGNGTSPLMIRNLNGTPGAGDLIYVDAVKLEVGSVATQYVPPSYSNLMTNPSFEAGTTGWAPGGTVPPTISITAAQTFVGSQALLVTFGAGAAGTGAASAPTSDVPSGTTVTFSAYVYSPVGQPDVKLDFWNGSGLIGGGPSTSVKGAWTRLVWTLVLPVALRSGTGFSIQNASTATSGQYIYVDAVQLELGNQASPYLDGTQYGGSWDSSNNLLTAAASSFEDGTVGGWTINSTGNGSVANSTAQANTGTHSLLYSSGTGTHAATDGAAFALPTFPPAGTTVTLSAWVYMPALSGSGLQIQSWDGVTLATGSTTTTVGSWVRLTLTRVMSSGCTQLNVSISYIAAPAASQTFYIDAVQIEQREYATPYGSTGTANASTSTFTSAPFSRQGATLTVHSNSTNRINQILRAVSGQAANVLEVQNSIGTQLATLGPDGRAVFANVAESVTSTATSLTVTTQRRVIVTATGQTITLPAVSAGRVVTVKLTVAGTCTVSPASGTIDGAASFSIGTQWQADDFVSDGTNWFVV